MNTAANHSKDLDGGHSYTHSAFSHCPQAWDKRYRLMKTEALCDSWAYFCPAVLKGYLL